MTFIFTLIFWILSHVYVTFLIRRKLFLEEEEEGGGGGGRGEGEGELWEWPSSLDIDKGHF